MLYDATVNLSGTNRHTSHKPQQIECIAQSKCQIFHYVIQISQHEPVKIVWLHLTHFKTEKFSKLNKLTTSL